MKSKSKVMVKDHGFNKLMAWAKDVARIGGAYAKVGVLASDQHGGLHEKGHDGKAAPLTVAEIFAILNFGTRDGKIPKRPVLETTFDHEREKLKAEGAKLIGEVVVGSLTLEQALNILGAKLASDVKAAIVKGFPPPNAPSVAIRKAMKGRTAKFFKQKKQRHIGDAIADAAVTQYVEHLGGYGRGGRKAVGAARTIGDSFAQIGAIASVKPFIDTGRLLNAITWAVVLGGHGHEDHE